jgi:DNA-binding beta-propeller fold protein YncE
MRKTQLAIIVCILLCQALGNSRTARAQEPQKIVKEGVQVEFQIAPASEKSQLMEEQDALVRFRITDVNSKTPIAGVRPLAWLTQREGAMTDSQACHEKIQSYLGGTLRSRPDIDLNSYYLLVLNQEPNISVIDPLLGFGGSKLITLIDLLGAGQDWVMTKSQRRLFVSMPDVDKVAVVDTDTWKVMNNVDTGAKPMRLSLQPDEKYLWVTTENGVAAVDTTTLKTKGQVITGPGPHDLAVSTDNRFVYITSNILGGTAGTLTAIDVRKLAKSREIKIGASASAVSFSPLGKTVYASDEVTGEIVVVNPQTGRVLNRIVVKPGVGRVYFAPDGRYGFTPNHIKGEIYIFDAATNQLLHTIPIAAGSDQIAFTREFAYVRSANTADVTMLRLSTIGNKPEIVKFPGGQRPPSDSSTPSSAAMAIVPGPEGNSMLVANIADRQIYYYTEGMAAPMGNFQNYRRDPRAVLVADRSLRETTTGVYETVTRLHQAGTYDVAFLLDTPRIAHCFEAKAAENPTVKHGRPLSLRIEYLASDTRVTVGEDYLLRFKLFDTVTNKPKDGLKDIHVLTFLAPGIWQKREFARGVGEGIYELRINLPESGVYLVFVESQSQGVPFRALPHLTLHAAK